MRSLDAILDLEKMKSKKLNLEGKINVANDRPKATST
jgi:hypothetical protein